MDAGVTYFILTGAVAGLTGGLVNLFLWHQTIKRKKILAVKIHEGFANLLTDSFKQAFNDSDLLNLKQIEKNILDLFDDFMSNKLTQKMPVLSMFVDEKLISEIRVVFHQEMESSLPRLLSENIKANTSSNSVSNILKKTINTVLSKYKWHGVFYLAIGTLTGTGIGLLFYLLADTL